VIAVVVSRADRASEHVGEHLLESVEWDRREDASRPDGEGGGVCYRHGGFELREFDGLHLDLEAVADAFGGDGDDPDLVVFVSRHSGETGPLLTAHFTGNFGPADYGGREGELATAAPAALSTLLAGFEEYAPEGYDVGMECTHHGPSDAGAPAVFAEVGSDEAEWDDPGAARAVARAVLDLDPARAGDRPGRTVVGVGGGHYAPRFERVVRETPWHVGHVAADWALEAMPALDSPAGRERLRRAAERSGTSRVLVDGEEDLRRAVAACEGLQVVGESWLRAVGDRPLDLVATVEDRLGTPGDGVAVGDREAPFAVRELPGELLAAAASVDLAATREAVSAVAVAFETREGGTRVGDRAALPVDPAGAATGADEGWHRPDASTEAAHDALVDGLVAVLATEYEVDRHGDEVVVHERAFDPALAREAGVPEGPAFGRLSAGEAVEVDGRTVEPGEVHVERTRRFDC
jgi:D-aminoacyl-tRNA deacylase